MVKSVESWAADNAIKRSRQERIDKAMCRPGYSWNETLQKCLPPVGYGDGSAPDLGKPQPPKETPPSTPSKPITAGAKIAIEGASRAAK